MPYQQPPNPTPVIITAIRNVSTETSILSAPESFGQEATTLALRSKDSKPPNKVNHICYDDNTPIYWDARNGVLYYT